LEHILDTDPPVTGPEVLRASGGKGTRSYPRKAPFANLQSATAVALTHVSPDTVVGLFLEEVSQSGQEIAAGSVEVSSKRLIWWLPDGRRGARVNLEGRQLEILILNELLDRFGRNQLLAVSNCMTAYMREGGAQFLFAPFYEAWGRPIPPAWINEVARMSGKPDA
jgi:hypothetical protein